MITAVYAGSFDPPTNGHLWMIEKGAKLFDSLVVAIGLNPIKAYSFSLEERLAMLQEMITPFHNVTVDSFENQYLVMYAQTAGASYILRGIRTQTDYEYERSMCYINADINQQIETVFLMPPREIAEVSSSFVKSLIGPAGWESVVSKYIPASILKKVTERFKP